MTCQLAWSVLERREKSPRLSFLPDPSTKACSRGSCIEMLDRTTQVVLCLLLTLPVRSMPSGTSRHINTPSVRSATDVCKRWTADRADRSSVQWTGKFDCPRGEVANSSAGSVRVSDKARMIGQLNLYRWLAGFDTPIESGGTFPADMRNPGYSQYKSSWAGRSRDDAAQACSYMLGSNAGIHFGHDDYCFVMGHIGTYQPDCGGVAPS